MASPSDRMDRRTALIVGAGIGGLAAGVALQRAGWSVRIVERADNPRELGFALNLAPNATAALRELGISDAVISDGHVTGAAEIRRGDGRVLRRINVAARRPAISTPSVVALRPVLHGALLDAVGRDVLRLGNEAVKFDVTVEGVVLALRDGHTVAGDVLIGADGVSSVIRKQLHPSEGPPRASGYCAVRGVAYGAAHLLEDLSAVGYFTDGIEAATVRASETAVYWYLSLLASDVPAIRDPLRIAERFAAHLGERFQEITRATRAEDIRFDELFDREPIHEWGTGPVTLLGDAAHPMLPHAGQGAAQALEDAVALALALASPDDVNVALRHYERVRTARTAQLVRLGRRIARITTTRSWTIAALRNAAVRVMPATALLRAYFLEPGDDPHRELRLV